MEYSENNDTQSNVESDPLSTKRPALVFLMIMMPIGVFGNIIVLYIYGCRLKKSPLNAFIFLLAIYDSMSCLFGVPLEVISILYSLNYPSNILCKLDKFMIFFTCTSSELTLLAISLERYNKICRFNKRQLKIFHAKISAIPINIIAILITIPPMLYFKRIDNKDMSICMYIVPYSKLQQYFIGLFVFNVLILAVMSVLYILVSRQANRRVTERSTSSQKDERKDFRRTFSEKKKTSRQINHIIASITVLFVISFIPSLLLGITYPLYQDIILSPPIETLRQFGIRLFILNSSLNPIVYGMLNTRFRNEFLKVLKVFFNIKVFTRASSTDTTQEDTS